MNVKQVTRYSLTKYFVSILFLTFIFSITTNTKAILGCSDVKMIFARGSSDNPDALYIDSPFSNDFKNLENTSGSFFQSIKTSLDRDYPSVSYDAVSVHNFEGLYNQNGYRAVGIFGPKTINNIFESELSWWPAGEYRQSVEDGIEETVGYIKDQIRDCPDQILILGGYSQGAHVIGDSLFLLTDEEQKSIQAVALFGDPKYLGSNSNNSTPVDYLNNINNKPKAKPWKRGTASLIDRGVLDARSPYLPTRLENRTLSWCFNDDFICTGGSGILQSAKPFTQQQTSTLNKDDLGAGHKRYATYGAPEAAQEIVQRISPKLNLLEAFHGGRDVSKSIDDNIPISPSDKPIDILLMFNISAGIDDVLGQVRSNSISVLPPFQAFYNNAYIGVGEYFEYGDITNRIPRAAVLQQPTLNIETLERVFYRKLAYGSLSGGGLDLEDPHMLGIEKAIRATNWRPEAEKHVVIITERPVSTSITYNMCDSSVRIAFGIEEATTCLTDPSQETGSSLLHSERCRYTLEILTNASCTMASPPSASYLVERNLTSLIELIEASDASVSFVVPHGFKSGTDIGSARTALQTIADASGGLYLEYETFTKASYSDLIWKVLNIQPNRVSINSLQYFDYFNRVVAESKGSKHLFLSANVPSLITLTGQKIYNQYDWDINGDGIVDESTNLPQLETKLGANSLTYLSVTASNSLTDRVVYRVPITVASSLGVAGPIKPLTPEVQASKGSDNKVSISFTCQSGNVLFIDIDKDSNPDISSPCSASPISPQEITTTSFFAWVENYDARSDTVNVLISSPADSNQSNSNSSNNNNTDNQNDNVEYPNNLIDKLKETLKMLYLSQELSSSTSNTYNPQKTQSVVQNGKSDQQAASFNQSLLASEFDYSAKKTFTNSDASTYLLLLVILPLLFIAFRILKSKK